MENTNVQHAQACIGNTFIHNLPITYTIGNVFFYESVNYKPWIWL